MSTTEKKTIKRKFEGVVVSDKANKTVVVLVSTTKMHPKYNKRYLSSKKYQAHDENNQYKVGDTVVIVETRPISKTKKWRVLSKKEKKG
jgi:small subunit ribosomal protein S17